MALSSLLLASALTFAPIQAQNETVVEETPIVETTDKQEINLEEFVANLTQKYSQMETWLAILFGTNGVSSTTVSFCAWIGANVNALANNKLDNAIVLLLFINII